MIGECLSGSLLESLSTVTQISIRAAQKTTMDFELVELAVGLYKSLAVPHCS